MKNFFLIAFWGSCGVFAQSLLLTPSGIKQMIQTGRLWVCDDISQIRHPLSESQKKEAAEQFDSRQIDQILVSGKRGAELTLISEKGHVLGLIPGVEGVTDLKVELNVSKIRFQFGRSFRHLSSLSVGSEKLSQLDLSAPFAKIPLEERDEKGIFVHYPQLADGVYGLIPQSYPLMTQHPVTQIHITQAHPQGLEILYGQPFPEKNIKCDIQGQKVLASDYDVLFHLAQEVKLSQFLQAAGPQTQNFTPYLCGKNQFSLEDLEKIALAEQETQEKAQMPSSVDLLQQQLLQMQLESRILFQNFADKIDQKAHQENQLQKLPVLTKNGFDTPEKVGILVENHQTLLNFFNKQKQEISALTLKKEAVAIMNAVADAEEEFEEEEFIDLAEVMKEKQAKRAREKALKKEAVAIMNVVAVDEGEDDGISDFDKEMDRLLAEQEKEEKELAAEKNKK
jgi:hypothetical protein